MLTYFALAFHCQSQSHEGVKSVSPLLFRIRQKNQSCLTLGPRIELDESVLPNTWSTDRAIVVELSIPVLMNFCCPASSRKVPRVLRYH